MHIAAQKPLRGLARIGYSARGVIYLVVGGLAVLTALGEGGETTGSQGAILQILYQPLGRVLLFVLILGLIGYSTWRFAQSLLDTDGHGHSLKGLAVRTGLVVSAVTHVFLAYWASRLLLSDGSSGSDSGEGSESFLASPVGQVLLVAVGIVLVGVGVAHLFKGATARFERHMEIPDQHALWMRPLCQFGLMARGVVWCLVGGFLLDSVRRFNTTEIEGMAEALNRLREAPYGDWLLGIVAAGLFAFGIYSCLEAVYRRLRV